MVALQGDRRLLPLDEAAMQRIDGGGVKVVVVAVLKFLGISVKVAVKTTGTVA